MAIDKGDLLDKLRRASNVRLTLELVFTDRDGNRTVRTRTIKLKR